MIFPADVWMNDNNYMEVTEVQGRKKRIPLYEEAFQTDRDINNVVAKIGEIGIGMVFVRQNVQSRLSKINALLQP